LRASKDANDMAEPLFSGRLSRMSRVTLIDGGLWLGLPGGQGISGKSSEGYPPYNIELLPADAAGDESLRITLAVAGFKPDELEVAVEGSELAIRGRQTDDAQRDYLHRGIAARQFRRSFMLAKGVEVRKAELHNGLLAVELERRSTEKQVVKVGIATAKDRVKAEATPLAKD
jgi:HSP20 family molecular chaperone IbpA